jgi:cardiolipin synthase
MSYRIFTTSEKAWQAMLADIAAARKTIYLQMYILGSDGAGNGFVAGLCDAARRGVEVKAVLDVVGSFSVWGGVADELRAAGAEVVYASFLFQRMHRKVLVVDDRVAFVGGVNIGKRYARWKDLQARVEGPIVDAIVRSFARAYRSCGGKGTIETKPHREGRLGRARLWFVDHGIGRRRHLMRRYYEERLAAAERSIELVTPYFIPPRWLLAQLHQAILRGASVEVVMPASTDYAWIDVLNRSFASHLVEVGGRCLIGTGMNHAKAMLIDRKEGAIGSQNIDLLSFHMNLEAGVFFEDPAMVRDLSAVIDKWKSEAKPFDPDRGVFSWYNIPLAFFLRLFGFLPLE